MTSSHESPALIAAGKAAYEIKFLVSETVASELEERAHAVLSLDPHVDATSGMGYRITSLYFDTPTFDVYHRSEGYRVEKHRLRRYGDSPMIFLERKSKEGGRVWKQRTLTTLDDAIRWSEGATNHPGEWFFQEVRERNLRPVCQVAYHRVAFGGVAHDGPIRLTIDRSARTVPTPELRVEWFDGGTPLLTDEAIVEFKFLSVMPVVFKQLIADLRLAQRSVSKYRRCAVTSGLIASGGDAHA